MLTDREREVKNVLIDQLGGPASFVQPNKALGYVAPEYLQISARRMLVNKRRLIIFGVLYTLVVLTAVAVMTTTTKNYNVLLWVGVGTFNAVNAAIHYSEYQKRKMAMAVFGILKDEEETE